MTSTDNTSKEGRYCLYIMTKTGSFCRKPAKDESGGYCVCGIHSKKLTPRQLKRIEEQLMKDDKPVEINGDNLTLNNLSEYIHTKVGEASTLFYDNSEHIFNESRALQIAETMINDITKLVEHGRRSVVSLKELEDNREHQ